jgi:hypothetical protein
MVNVFIVYYFNIYFSARKLNAEAEKMAALDLFRSVPVTHQEECNFFFIFLSINNRLSRVSYRQ